MMAVECRIQHRQTGIYSSSIQLIVSNSKYSQMHSHIIMQSLIITEDNMLLTIDLSNINRTHGGKAILLEDYFFFSVFKAFFVSLRAVTHYDKGKYIRQSNTPSKKKLA